MNLLVAGIYECPNCKKILKENDEKAQKEEERKVIEGILLDGEYFHSNVSLNKDYEIAESGIIINKTSNRLFAVLICHSPMIEDEKYVRLSWWKSLQHAGMFKIYNRDVLNNTIHALERIDGSFDDLWNWTGKYGKKEPKTKEDLEKEKNLDLIRYRIIENKTCPKCQKTMDKMKAHYECPHCGEIVILEGYNQPIFNINPKDLDLRFQSDFPINYYLPVNGITVKWLMGEWKSIVVIYTKDAPNKKWLRFYWWARDLSRFMKYGRREMGENTQMGWKAQRGIASPNVYDKKLLAPLIDALKIISTEVKL
jgi:ssDNA-binding Zn-finger/Zn-ribbon topoisomerase 1